LLRRGGLVKTRRFKDAKYVGDPVNAIRIFNEKEVDELMVLDIVASREGMEPDYRMIGRFAGECFMPLCYGGGIRTLDHAKRVFGLGVEKVCLQSAVLERPAVITEIAGQFGCQSVVVSVDIKRDWLRRPRLYRSSSGETLGRDWLAFLRSAVDAGAGEVVLNAVDRDGEMGGYDIELIRQAAEAVSVPLIALGGAGTPDHFRQAVMAGASAVAAGAMFVFYGPHRAVLISYPPYSELESLFD
jgi:cyclase